MLITSFIWSVFLLATLPGDYSCKKNLDTWVPEIAHRLSRDSIWYDARKGSDCSGMMHRLFDSLEQRCSNFDLPGRSYRDSKGLAAYYAKSKALEIVSDPLKSAKQIRTGMLLFFSYTPSAKGDKIPEGICHVGMVTGILEGPDGNRVSGIELFHGHRPGTVASISTLRNAGKSSQAYRNGAQYWVAYAAID